MIKIIVSRNGMLKGVSIIPTRNIHNPYFLFGAECTEKNQNKLIKFMKRADEIQLLATKTNDKKGVIPEFTIRTLLLWINFNSRTELSYPETACIPSVQSYLMCLFAAINEEKPKKTLTIITVSEYIVRVAQLLVAHGILKQSDIELYDTDPKGVPQTMDFQI